MAWTFEGSLDGFWEAVGLLFIGMLVATLYFVGHYSTTGQTPGKDLLGIRIVSIDGSGLSLGKGLLRCMGLFSFGPLIVGNFWAVWDHDGQAWHDKIAGTTVVRDDGQAAPTLPPKDARRRQKRWLVGLALPMLLVWLGAAELAGLGCIDAASRINALRWIDHSGPVQDAIRIDMSSLGLQLAEVQSLRAEGLPGSYTSGAIAKYRYQGQVVTWLAALRYDSAEAQDTREASSSVEQSFLDKYCPPLSCDWTHTRGERSFVMAMADDGTVDPTDVLNLVRGSPRTEALRWLHLLFTGRG